MIPIRVRTFALYVYFERPRICPVHGTFETQNCETMLTIGRCMSVISRRGFFGRAVKDSAVAGLLSAGARVLGANPLGMPIGCQT